MRAIALLAMFIGLGCLVAQEPPKDKDGPPKGRPQGKGEKRGPISFKKLLEMRDKDKDGYLSKEELKDRNMWDRWKNADVDMDGKLSEKEFDDYQKELLKRVRDEKKKD